MCISAGQNGAGLIKMAREEIGPQPCSKVILHHAQQDFDTISSGIFLFSPFFTCLGKPLLDCYQGRVLHVGGLNIIFEEDLRFANLLITNLSGT